MFFIFNDAIYTANEVFRKQDTDQREPKEDEIR